MIKTHLASFSKIGIAILFSLKLLNFLQKPRLEHDEHSRSNHAFVLNLRVTRVPLSGSLVIVISPW